MELAGEGPVELDMSAFNYPLGTSSASGALLDPVMASLPSSVLEQMRGNRPPVAPGFSVPHGSAISDAAMKIVAEKFDAAANGGSVADEAGKDVLGSADLMSTLKCFVMMDTDMQGMRQLQKRLDKRGHYAFVSVFEQDGMDEYVEEYDPAQEVARGVARVHRRQRSGSVKTDNTLHMTSVMRKRRLKMKKHKLRKRRRAERAQKRKLGN